MGRRGAKRRIDFSGMGQLTSHHDHETVIPLDLIFLLAILYFFLLLAFCISYLFCGFTFILYHLPFISLPPFSV